MQLKLVYTNQKRGARFTAIAVKRIAGHKIYIGIFESKLTDKITHRPDLQIISVEQFERVQALIASRAGNGRERGRRGKYIFTGFVICGGCGGPMVASKHKPGVVRYECVNRRYFGKAGCAFSKAYGEHLILPPVVEYIADLIQNQIDFYRALNAAARRHGKSVVGEAHEAAVRGELASVRAGKERLVDAISAGVLTQEEAAAKLAELREQERRLTIELSSIAEKARVCAEWQNAVGALTGRPIAASLYGLAEDNPVAFRRLLGLIFKPNSLRVRTYRTEGGGWAGALEGYELTEVILQATSSFDDLDDDMV